MEGPMDYGTTAAAPEGIGGGIGSSPEGGSKFITIYIAVSDLAEALAKVESLGGKRVMEPFEIPGVVAFAQFADPQGNVVGIVRDDDVEAPSPGVGAPVGWFEILGTDGAALRDFYGAAFGWEFKVAEEMDYGEVDTKAGRGISGGVGKSQGEPTTTVYAAVDDLAKYLERAESLGGKAVLQPMTVGGGTEIAAFRDPQDHLFGLYKHVHPH
jgi:hypothetical protein